MDIETSTGQSHYYIIPFMIWSESAEIFILNGMQRRQSISFHSQWLSIQRHHFHIEGKKKTFSTQHKMCQCNKRSIAYCARHSSIMLSIALKTYDDNNLAIKLFIYFLFFLNFKNMLGEGVLQIPALLRRWEKIYTRWALRFCSFVSTCVDAQTDRQKNNNSRATRGKYWQIAAHDSSGQSFHGFQSQSLQLGQVGCAKVVV